MYLVICTSPHGKCIDKQTDDKGMAISWCNDMREFADKDSKVTYDVYDFDINSIDISKLTQNKPIY